MSMTKLKEHKREICYKKTVIGKDKTIDVGSNIGLYWLVLYSEIFNIGRIGNLRPGPEIEQENVCSPYYKIENDKISLIFMYLSFSFFIFNQKRTTCIHFNVLIYHSLSDLRFSEDIYSMAHLMNRNVLWAWAQWQKWKTRNLLWFTQKLYHINHNF